MPNGEDKALPVSTSTPPVFAPEQERFFREVLELLNRHQVLYAVSGAFAIHQHSGVWRDTKDLDIFLPVVAIAGALRGLRQAGFHCEITDPVWLAKAWRGDYFVDFITGMSNCVISVDHSWIERAQTTEAFGIRIPVLAPEEVIASKLFVDYRERFDGADIAHVVYGTRGKLDWARLLQLIGEHWELLLWALLFFRYAYPAHSDMVPRPLWELLLGRFQDELRNPNPHAPFRGTLLDERMFAIDVREWGMADPLREYRARRGLAIREPAADTAA